MAATSAPSMSSLWTLLLRGGLTWATSVWRCVYCFLFSNFVSQLNNPFPFQASGKIVFNSKLQEAVHQCMAPWLPENVSDRISQCEPLMAAFAWHRQFVFQTPGGVRAMFGGSTGSSAKGGGVSEGGSQRGSGRSGGGGSAASQGTTNEEPQHQRPQGAHGTEGSALLDSVSKARGLSSQDKVLAWDAAEADTVCGDFEPRWIV